MLYSLTDVCPSPVKMKQKMHVLLSTFLGILLSLNVFSMYEKVNIHVTKSSSFPGQEHVI